MAFLDKFIDFISGGVGGKIVDAVSSHFPPDMSELDKEKLKIAITEASRQHELELIRLAQNEQNDFNQRIKDLEGTASDLSNSGWPGRVIIFLRGAQRPIWGFVVLWLDLKVFSGDWKLNEVAQATSLNTGMDIQSAFWLINFLVLGFLFGERAVLNIIPVLQNKMGAQPPAAGSSQDRAVG
jgi:hypothetical protein